MPSRCVALAQDHDSVAVEFIEIARAAGHGHDQCQAGAGHLWAGTSGEGAVGGRQEQAADASFGEDGQIRAW